MFLVTIGIVYGDIGTSPMYVMKSIISANGGITQVNEDFIVGALSLIIWTITLLTTVKYVLIAMKADNNGEGGIFSLYSLVKKCGKWLIVPAMIGGSALLADGVLTPAVTVTTAVEGLRSISAMDRFLGSGQGKVIAITLTIIAVLFAVQRVGTSKIGRAFGPIMLLWFGFLGGTGVAHILKMPSIIRAINPVYAVQVLLSDYNKAGFMILGSVFLAATGAEALYSDMGHVGKEHIYRSWVFVKLCLILNYLGQGTWIISNSSDAGLAAIEDLNPFFLMLPTAWRPFAVILGAAAAIIASQALITGSYTLVSEAIRLDLMPHMQIRYPSDTKGQIYIGAVNTVLFAGCALMVLFFRSAAKMESAYGLAITVTMLMTTLLLGVYLWKIKKHCVLSILVLAVFGSIESVFFISSLGKIAHGGYVAAIIALLLLFIMIVWHKGTELERKYSIRLNMYDYIENLRMLKNDTETPLCANNLVFLDKHEDKDTIDRDILYSILDKDPKRAEAYWFFSMDVTDEPNASRYSVETYGTDFIFRVNLELGFKNDQLLNFYLRQIVGDLTASGELPAQQRKFSIYGPSNVGSFKFGILRRSISPGSELTRTEEFILSAKYFIRHLCGSAANWYGLETSSIITEYVPLAIPGRKIKNAKLERIYPASENKASEQ